jgi:hypothetical protein
MTRGHRTAKNWKFEIRSLKLEKSTRTKRVYRRSSNLKLPTSNIGGTPWDAEQKLKRNK